jgi:hypothetical protein
MPNYVAPAGSRVTMKVRVDKRPYLAGFQTPPHKSNWENIKPDNDGMGESREFVMPQNAAQFVSFNGQYDEKIGPNDPDPKATYDIVFTGASRQIGTDKVAVQKGTGPVARQYKFTAN